MNRDSKIARQFEMSSSELSDWKLSMNSRYVQIREDLATMDILSVLSKHSLGPTDLALLMACGLISPEEVESCGLRAFLQEQNKAYA